MTDDTVKEQKPVPEGDVIVRTEGGKMFRCSCGCNVFRHPNLNPNKFKCNSCNAIYIGK